MAPVGRAQLHEYGDGPPARRASRALGGRSRGRAGGARARSTRRTVHGRVVDLERRAIRAALSAHDGDREHAAREYAAILPELAEMGLAYKQALVVLDMALVLGPDDPVVRASVDDARAILERLGARAISARLDELMGEAADSRSGGSSVHETEVEARTNGTAAVPGRNLLATQSQPPRSDPCTIPPYATVEADSCGARQGPASRAAGRLVT